ncbi:predicted protein [Histoplasma capsulatum H143]|uniref:Uncharacterized protein n=1 Tax=Ajellomyces capsulatus (strain H143) TaxID=544712 RepID=C6HLW1_AJECH|nr:predicted protein [Histoplasma capsulatum H143]
MPGSRIPTSMDPCTRVYLLGSAGDAVFKARSTGYCNPDAPCFGPSNLIFGLAKGDYALGNVEFLRDNPGRPIDDIEHGEHLQKFENIMGEFIDAFEAEETRISHSECFSS